MDMTPRDFWNTSTYPSALGLSLGISAVAVGHVFLLIYFCTRRYGLLGELKSVQKTGARQYDIWEGLKSHLAQPEGFVMLGAYLTGTWITGLMPPSYYSFTGGIDYTLVFVQLLLQDIFQTIMHMLEHKLSPKLYQKSHKPHHRFTNPRLFDAFDGSPADTFLMILVPLYLTALCVPANVWTYMTFGSVYANWLVFIHAEYPHPWDWVFRKIGFGTAADHHVHHKLFIYNFGHTFMYWDWLAGSYMDPGTVAAFNKGV
jgi:sterol desaturase/sphingolipid hydroxylase (fatty acid hydroxylase superfamily)